MADEIPIANPDEVPTSGSGVFNGRLFEMWMGAYGTKLYVWASGLESAFEIMAEWADEHAPGVLTDVSESDYRAAAANLGVEWDPSWPDYGDPDFERVAAAAEADLTVIGHTTLKHGQFIPSWEWGGDKVAIGSSTYNEVWSRSMIETWGHDFDEGDSVRWLGRDTGDPDEYVVTRVNGDELDLEGERKDGQRVAYTNVDTEEVEHAE